MKRMHWEKIAQHLHLLGVSAQKARNIYWELVKLDPLPRWVTHTYHYYTSSPEWKIVWCERTGVDAKNARNTYNGILIKFEARFVRWVRSGEPKSRAFSQKRAKEVVKILKKYKCDRPIHIPIPRLPWA